MHKEVIVAGGTHSDGQSQIVQVQGCRGEGSKEKEWTDWVADDLRMFGKTAALELVRWCRIGLKEGWRFMTAWKKEEQ